MLAASSTRHTLVEVVAAAGVQNNMGRQGLAPESPAAAQSPVLASQAAEGAWRGHTNPEAAQLPHQHAFSGPGHGCDSLVLLGALSYSHHLHVAVADFCVRPSTLALTPHALELLLLWKAH